MLGDLVRAKKWWSQDLNPSWLMCEANIFCLLFIRVCKCIAVVAKSKGSDVQQTKM